MVQELVNDTGSEPVANQPIRPGEQTATTLDAFVQRSLGTMLELERHQQQGGAIVLAYPDGSYRQVDINANADGKTDLLLFSWAVWQCRAQAAAGEHRHGDEGFGCVESVGAFGQCS